MITIEEIKKQYQLKIAPNFPEKYLPSTGKKKSPANELTDIVVKYSRLKDCYAGRINTTGTYDEKLGIYRKSASAKGVSDVIVCCKGRFIAPEIKIGKDTIRESQMKFRDDVEKSGGIYIIIKHYYEYVQFLDNFLKTLV